MMKIIRKQDCDVCGEDVAVLVRIGDELDYKPRWQDVCMTCLKKARMLIMAAMEDAELNAIADAREDMPSAPVKMEGL